jgi:hypothetical protein
MKAETADYLAKARATLAGAQQIAAVPLPHIAAREAYYAAYHAAEAYIFEQTGKAATTDRGVRSEFARLARRETAYQPRAYPLPCNGLPDQGECGLWHRPCRHADLRRSSRRRHHNGGPLHRHHHPIAASRRDATPRTARAAVTAQSGKLLGPSLFALLLLAQPAQVETAPSSWPRAGLVGSRVVG